MSSLSFFLIYEFACPWTQKYKLGWKLNHNENLTRIYKFYSQYSKQRATTQHQKKSGIIFSNGYIKIIPFNQRNKNIYYRSTFTFFCALSNNKNNNNKWYYVAQEHNLLNTYNFFFLVVYSCMQNLKAINFLNSLSMQGWKLKRDH